MRTILFSLAILSLVSSAAHAADDAAIKERLAAFEAVWNNFDPAALAAMFDKEGDLINPMGVHAKGPEAIQKLIGEEHGRVFKNTTYSHSDVRIQWATPDVAIADVTGKISGMRTADGAAAPDFEHHVTWVLVKKDGKWLVAAARPYQFGAKK
jgi:uncharacterized protein (TIGR02246 family)